jgi:hypothetical protein
MVSAADLIDAIRRRARRSLRPDRPAGEFPEGWRGWFEAMGAGGGRVSGAPAAAVVAIMEAREPRPPPAAVAELGRWRAFTTLWRQEWQPASEDERSQRVAALVASLALHVFFALVLVWLVSGRYAAPAPADEARGDDVIEVQYVGEGTPDDAGAGEPAARDAAPAAAAAGPQRPQVAPEAPTPPTPAAPAPVSRDIPEPVAARIEPPRPQPPEPPVVQALQVTEVPVPDTEFVVPPARPVDLDLPATRVPEVAAPTREITVVEVPRVDAGQRLRPRDIPVPDLDQPATELAIREIPSPAPPIQTPPLVPAEVAVPELSAPVAGVPTREIPMPAPAAPAQPAPEGAAAPAAQQTPGTAVADAARGPRAGGARPAAPTTGAGTRPGRPPGAAPSPVRGDDWGDSLVERPGGRVGDGSGLFNADGSPRLPGAGRVGGGLPPGTVTEDFEKIDRMGTWLKRPPSDYEPTAFDRFWVPHENLLEEWVRRSIKEVLIPIPGTGKSIQCAVALLALGGACGITDANMMDVEAEARQPPDVPFKPELQEDQDSLRRQGQQP